MATTEIKPATVKNGPPPPKKHAGGRPPAAKSVEVKDRRQIEFYEQVNSISDEDWGSRAELYLYRLEPFTDRRKSGDFIYIMKYKHPVDEDRVMVDFGSGRYRLMLTMRKLASDERGAEVARFEFEINNQKFPPQIAEGEWVNDPRNIKWAWARPTATPNGQTQPQPQSAVLETLQVLTHIEDRAAERAQASQPPQQSISDQLGQVKQILDITQGGGQTVLMEMFRDELRASRARQEKLEDELRARNNPPAITAVDPFAQLKQMADGVKRLKDLGLFGGSESKENGSGGNVSRSRMGAWMEFFQPVLPEVAGIVKAFAVPLAGVMAQKMMQRPQPTGQPQPPPQQPNVTPQSVALQQPTGSHATTAIESRPSIPAEAQPILEIIEQVTPKMIEYVISEKSGGEFAELIADWYTVERVQQIQVAPPDQMMEFYKHTPFWNQLKDRERQFLKFLTEFAAWKPESEEDEDTPSDGDEEEVEVG
jgi:hypothetical protein